MTSSDTDHFDENDATRELVFEDRASGFLFVGDPHVSTRRPGRRKDDDYQTTILNKLAEAVRIANEHNYVVVILGDLLDEPVPGSESLKNRLIRILKSARFKVVNLLGNHERTHAKLSDDDTLPLLENSGAFDLIRESGPYGVFDFEGTRIGLGGTPYGEDIPDDVSDMFPGDCKSVVWITHHDLAFEGAYPGSRPLHEIKGCKLAVNGHMHLMKKIRKEGETTWFNPGNITRQAVDAIEHTPRVWGFDQNGRIEPFELTHRKDVFDLTGRLISSITEDSEDEEQSLESVFVQLIQVEDSEDFSKTDDGTVIREQIETMFEDDNTDTKVRSLVVSLLNDVVESEQAA
ncbi:metallophosphoesterase family protein [Salipiger mucosus]|uniref:Calcineurin-like phosphoesterase domain-containing protein n=1 Tax=Salipiger mucosus DSM 16094 TaxID=1123237 RepID=S9QV16_9RHOB|nr:metallophosphoesterase [Salipiger mucosus]EPX83422.1 hypothetical protein Salmuc_02030 [Salipiger mucosus DSM 16094]